MEQNCWRRHRILGQFELLHRSDKLGISQRRAEWFTRWTREVAQAGHINISNFEEGLGRVMYVVAALEYERPFLESHGTSSFFLSHLSKQMAEPPSTVQRSWS